jgi:hypothetical protein
MPFGIFCLFVRYLITAEHRRKEFEKGMWRAYLYVAGNKKWRKKVPNEVLRYMCLLPRRPALTLTAWRKVLSSLGTWNSLKNWERHTKFKSKWSNNTYRLRDLISGWSGLYDAPHMASFVCPLYSYPVTCSIFKGRILKLQSLCDVEVKQDPPLLCISLMLLQLCPPPCCCSTGPSDPPGNCCCCCCWTIDRNPARLPTSQHFTHLLHTS